MEKLSIIFSVFNGVKYLDTLIQNVESIDYDNLEVICVVDAHSTDDSVQRYTDLFLKHGDWRIIIQKGNGKLGEARNIGLEAATGEYIWCCDVDDRFDRDMPKEMIESMERYDADISRCNYMRIVASEYDGTLPLVPDKDYEIIVMDREEALHARFEEKMSLTTWSMIFRRRFIDEGLRFISGGVAEDDYFTIMTLSRAGRVCYHERPMYYYIFDDKAGWRVRSTAEEKKAVYDQLIQDFIQRDDPMTEELRSFSIRLALHEAILMDKTEFIRFTRSREFLDEYRNHCKKNKKEMFIFLHFPSLYYRLTRHILLSKEQPKSFAEI